MRNYTCPGCSSAFYTAVARPPIKCPYCGFVLRQTNLEGRRDKRSPLRRNCRIVKDDSEMPAETTDISRKGAGVVIKGLAPIKMEDIVHVEIKDFDLDSDAMVVWVQPAGAQGCRAGLRFL